MKYALIGGDRRAVLLAGMLLEDGHRLRSFALERAELPEGVERALALHRDHILAEVVSLAIGVYSLLDLLLGLFYVHVDFFPSAILPALLSSIF